MLATDSLTDEQLINLAQKQSSDLTETKNEIQSLKNKLSPLEKLEAERKDFLYSTINEINRRHTNKMNKLMGK